MVESWLMHLGKRWKMVSCPAHVLPQQHTGQKLSSRSLCVVINLSRLPAAPNSNSIKKLPSANKENQEKHFAPIPPSVNFVAVAVLAVAIVEERPVASSPLLLLRHSTT
jgi:hypothetical protein